MFQGGRYSVLCPTKCFRTAKWELLLRYAVLYPGSRAKWRADGRARRQASNITSGCCERALSRLPACDVPIVSSCRFLLLKPVDYIRHSGGAESTATKYEDWVGVLHLATMWGFVEVWTIF